MSTGPDTEAERNERLSAAELKRRQDDAEALRAEGEADAAATKARGEAEAKAMEELAAAYTHFTDKAIADRALKIMPEMVTAAGKPMENIDSLTVIDSEGASKVPKFAMDNISQAKAVAKDLLGLDLDGLLSGLSEESAAPVVDRDTEKKSEQTAD